MQTNATMNCLSAMRRILLATILLSVAMSESISFWSKTKRPLHIPPKLEGIMNYDDDKQFPRISNTHFISEPINIPSLAVIRQPEFMQLSQGLLSADKSKLNNVKPTVSISIGIQEGQNNGGSLQQDCSTSRHHKFGQDWQLQQPFYVEEPHWVEINADYADGSVRRLESGDPYILSRGKKFRVKDQQQVEKRVEDYEEILDYSSGSNTPSARSRLRRSAKADEELWADQKKTNRFRDEKFSNVDEETEDEEDISMRDLPFEILEENYADDDEEENTNGVASRKGFTENINDETVRVNEKSITDANNGSMRSLTNEILTETREKRGNRDDIGSIKMNFEKKGTNILGKIKNRGKKLRKGEARNANDKSSEKQQASERKARNDEDNAATELNLKDPETRIRSNNRTKRSTYEISPEFRKDLWLENEKKSAQSRNKHSNTFDLKTLSSDPYFIVRGKKIPYELENALYYWTTERRNELGNSDTRNFSIEDPLKNLLMKRCDNANCGNDMIRLLQSMPNSRDRRDKLGKILKYDPFVIVRGKRLSLDDLQIDKQFEQGDRF